MDPLLEKLREAISFSAREKRGTLVVIVIMILALYLPEIKLILFPIDREQVEITYLAFERHLTEDNKHRKEKKAEARFDFDPNTVSKRELLKLGFPNYLSDRLIKYRNSGAKFREKKDLLKLYGMPNELYHSLSEHIVIPREVIIEKESKRPLPVSDEFILDLNIADSNDLIRIKGIGPVFARRIIKYRESLGGFVRLEQLKEVYGITDSSFVQFRKHIVIGDSLSVKLIPINNVDAKELTRHPYFRNWKMANALVKYRKANGRFETLDDLYSVHLLNDSIIKKIDPYLIFE